ncbi:DUF4476 domain-containing protein [Pontibacter qinzhouensis]|uniref:DUF4476 domain-containing protein n=1 Tax=Pontibacter qinzhouensis TaxID=2603253 RepID=A0A5C8KDT8_9BACT|nr:DUF4476 domain-containing protein [Pontibacter qinzhouensis]TXK52907.1 DUF4476 domain-containing protein [Pontibacter qinzhouensis]
MKKLLLPLLLVLLPLFTQASAVTFSTKRGEPFQMYLNGKLVNSVARNVVRVANLQPGQHLVEFSIRGRYGIYRTGTRVLLPVGFESNYRLVVVGRNGRVRIQRLADVPLRPPVGAPLPQQPNQPRHYPGEYGTPQQQEQLQEPAVQTPADDDYCQNAITRYDFDKLLESIKARELESTKLTIAREAVRSNSITSEDLKELLEQFEYEGSRVEFAKFAYERICDKERFYYVYDAFKFDTSIQEMEKFINSRRR